MSYALRNTLIIAVFWTLILAGGSYYIYGVQEKNHTRLLAQNTTKTHRVDELKSMEAEREVLIEQYQHLRELSMGKMGMLAANESPGETYDYILREMKKTGSKLIVNLRFKEIEAFRDFHRRVYTLSGLGKFSEIYKLVWFLESGPIYYDVHTMKIDRITAEAKVNAPLLAGGEIVFEMDVWGYNKSDGLEIEEVVRESGDPAHLAELVTNPIGQAIDYSVKMAQNQSRSSPNEPGSRPADTPFQRVSSETSKAKDDGLPRVNSDTKILAITPFHVIIRDRNGKLKKLRTGDRVSGGMLQTIDVEANRVVFSMTSGNRKLELSAKN